jgi:hypothetical protein
VEYRQLWEARFDRLDTYLQKLQPKKKTRTTSKSSKRKTP